MPANFDFRTTSPTFFPLPILALFLFLLAPDLAAAHPLYDALTDDEVSAPRIQELLQDEDNREVLNDPPRQYRKEAEEKYDDWRRGRAVHYADSLAKLKVLVENGAKLEPEVDGTILLIFMGDVPHPGDAMPVARFLLSRGVNLGKADNLFYSLGNSSYAMTKLILDQGAPVDAIDPATGNTPLHDVIANFGFGGQTAKAKLLLQLGANVNARNRRGETPLHACDSPAICELLLSRGTDPDAQDVFGLTRLHRLTAANNFTTLERDVKQLLKYRANPNLKALDGAYPAHGWDEPGKQLGAQQRRTLGLLKAAGQVQTYDKPVLPWPETKKLYEKIKRKHDLD